MQKYISISLAAAGCPERLELKDLISNQGIRKEAFYTMCSFYKAIREGTVVFGSDGYL